MSDQHASLNQMAPSLTRKLRTKWAIQPSTARRLVVNIACHVACSFHWYTLWPFCWDKRQQANCCVSQLYRCLAVVYWGTPLLATLVVVYASIHHWKLWYNPYIIAWIWWLPNLFWIWLFAFRRNQELWSVHSTQSVMCSFNAIMTKWWYFVHSPCHSFCWKHIHSEWIERFKAVSVLRSTKAILENIPNKKLCFCSLQNHCNLAKSWTLPYSVDKVRAVHFCVLVLKFFFSTET